MGEGQELASEEGPARVDMGAQLYNSARRDTLLWAERCPPKDAKS